MVGQGRPVQARPYEVVHGVAIINIAGTLVNKNGYLNPRSGMMGYDGIQAQFFMAMDDPQVKKIVFDIDSPGGEVAGCFDLCDLIREFRGEKETVAFVGEKATSAAYAIASSCRSVYLPRTGMVGSIGVLTAHRDVSERLDKEGVKVTLIHSGRHKVDGHPFAALPEGVREKIQAKVDTVRGMFADTVAKNRGLSVSDVLATEASVYQGEQAVQQGLADAVLSYNEVVNTMIEKVNKEEKHPAHQGSVQASLVADNGTSAAGQDTEHDKAVSRDAPLAAAPLSTLCEDARAAHLIPVLIQSEATESEVMARIEALTELRGVLTAAQLSPEQIAAIETGKDTVAVVRALLEEQAKDEDIAGHTLEGKVPTRDFYAVYDKTSKLGK